ncbi:MAG: hypothetical protein M1837_007517 [Sclerophora amabilis]|nr:MAG: hypothetical protein M1837_007517 [Sclerophora amabilis]
MAPVFQNQTCDPFVERSELCSLGNLVGYSIGASSAEDVVAGLKFAEKHNIRLVVRNTGHDFLGKSTGKGALGIWTRDLDSIEIQTNYTSPSYSGPVMKMGAGVVAAAAYAAAHKRGYIVLGGTCSTVGLAGGYTQGGGHSLLSSMYGMAADNVVEWELITANGTHVLASPTKNLDLYWALSGGGPGTFGTVISMTTKVHRDSQIGGASFALSLAGTSADSLWEAVAVWQAGTPAIVDSGSASLYQMTNSTFSIQITSPNRSKEQVKAQLNFLTSHLAKRNITYSLNTTSFSNYYDHFEQYFGPLPYGAFPITQLTGSRLIPRSVVENNNKALVSVMRNVTNNGHFYVACVALNTSHAVAGTTPESNSVLPAWRSSVAQCITPGPWDWTLPWEEMLAREDELTNEIAPAFEALTPGSGTYMNEGNYRQANWQEEFYGINYDRLRSIKKAVDPNDLFYGITNVGSEAWTANADGRLCRT